jgi:hypothetical protein
MLIVLDVSKCHHLFKSGSHWIFPSFKEKSWKVQRATPTETPHRVEEKLKSSNYSRKFKSFHSLKERPIFNM